MTKRIHPEPEIMPTRLAVALKLYLTTHNIQQQEVEKHTGVPSASLSRFLSGYNTLSTINYVRLQNYLMDYHPYEINPSP